MKHFLIGQFFGTIVKAAIQFDSQTEAEIMQPLVEESRVLTQTKTSSKTNVPISQHLLNAVITYHQQGKNNERL